MDSPASNWVSRFLPVIPEGQVLDLACGDGRHSALLASAGKQVLAVDRNADALSGIAAKGIATLQIDLEVGNKAALAELFPPQRFAGIVVTNYLHRPLVPWILNSIAGQGVLLYETFSAGNQQFGKPTNPHFLLMQGELLQWLATDRQNTWHVLAFEDGYVELPKPAMVQRLCAIKGNTPSSAHLRLD
ncbi:class I SAM-dependent methyltransferase [Glaciimonas sp. GG7]